MPESACRLKDWFGKSGEGRHLTLIGLSYVRLHGYLTGTVLTPLLSHAIGFGQQQMVEHLRPAGAYSVSMYMYMFLNYICM